MASKHKKVKIVAISDIHGVFDFKLPKGDILTISGDICPVRGSHHPTKQEHWVNNHLFPWCRSLIEKKTFKHICFIFGNHDFIGEKLMKNGDEDRFRHILPEGVHYLRDSLVELEGIKIYGTPWSKRYRDWAFMSLEEGLDNIYAKIPTGMDVVLCHGPAYGWCDAVEQYPYNMYWDEDKHLGSISLRNHVLRAKPKWLLVGHIHSGIHSVTTVKDDGVEKINVANVSLIDELYVLSYDPLVFEIEPK